jgi:hypothetical protein
VTNRTVALFGTNHVYQFGGGVRLAGDYCTEDQEAGFRLAILSAAHVTHAQAIAEEMSIEALKLKGKSSSVVFQIAKSLDLQHRYCDPDKARQQALSIACENAVRAVGQMERLSEEDIESNALMERRKREPVWAAELKELNVWPVLFICGSWHIPTFSALLRSQSFEILLCESCWSA